MGTMDKIRQTSPIILAVIAVLFIGFMVISDLDLGSLSSRSDRSMAVVGTVNGEDILYTDFEKRVEQMMEQQRTQMGPDAEIDDEPIRQQVWNQLVERALLRQQAEKLGITVTDAEVRETILENPPAEWRQSFTDPKTGEFNRQGYVQLMQNPALISQLTQDPEVIANFPKNLLMFEDYIRDSRLQQKIQEAVAATVSALPNTYLQQQYKVANSSADVSYIAINTSTISDQDVQVSDSEVEKFYEKNKAYYKQKPARQIKYVAIPLQASSADSASAQKKITRLAERLRGAGSLATRDSVFDDAVSDLNGEVHDFKLVKDIDPMKYAYLSNVPDMEVVGPVRLADGVYFFRADGRRSGSSESEVVKAAHILIKFNDNKDSAKAEATRILGLVKGGEDFAKAAGQYSTDGSAQRGGDLGYFTRGEMVKPFADAAFAATPGSIVGPVESEFGYHIIKVEDKKSEELKFTEIRIAPTMSSATRNQALALANRMKMQIEEGKSFDAVAKEAKLEPALSGFFQSSTPALGSSKLSLFAFESEKGAVAEPTTIKQLGVVLAQVSDVRTEGIKPLEDMKEEIRARLIRQKKLDKIKAKAEDIQRKIAAAGSFAAAKAMDSTLAIATASVKDNGQVPGLGMESAFTSSAFRLPLNKVSEPIRGERAYFVMQVTNRTDANMAGFEAQRPDLYKAQIDRMKNSAYYIWMNSAKEHAKIEDNRMSLYRM